MKVFTTAGSSKQRGFSNRNFVHKMNETSSRPYGKDFFPDLPSWEVHIFFVWLAVASIIIVTLNTGICILVWTQRRLRNTGNLYFVNLAIADVLVGIVAIPWKLLHYVVSPMPLWILLLATVVDYVLSLSFLSICALTYDRYRAIIYPLTYPSKMALRNSWKRLLLIWTVPCLNFCRVIWMTSPHISFTKFDRAFSFFLFSCMVLATGGVIFAYVRIFLAARIQEHQQRELRKCSIKRLNRRIKNKFTKAIRSCLGVTICFLCCWLPRGSYLIARKSFLSSRYEYDLITFGLMCFSPILNPIIYSICNRDVRRTLKIILWKRGRESARSKKENIQNSFVSSQRTATASSRETYALSQYNNL